MGKGLGKNSPVVLSLGRENYEALLDRHGQWTRWRQAIKCACLDEHTQQPDIHCKRCGGRGIVYTFQPTQIVQCIVMAKDTSGILMLLDEYKDDELIAVTDTDGNEIETTKNGIYLVMDKSDVKKGSYYNIRLERTIEKTIKETTMTANGRFWTVEGTETKRTNIEGIYYTVPGDIVSIGKIVDALDYEFEVDEYRQNKVILKEKTITVDDITNGGTKSIVITPTEPLTAENVVYIPPFVFAILNQNMNKSDFDAMVEAQGDAVVTFPYSCDVAESDVLTVLAGTITQKDVIAHTGDTNDKLPAFFVSEIVRVIDNAGNEYKNGTDFVLCGTNEIKWINDAIEVGDGYSVTYKVYPTYTVAKNIPQLRSSEDQRFPKKAVLKLMTSYSEQRKVNRQ